MVSDKRISAEASLCFPVLMGQRVHKWFSYLGSKGFSYVRGKMGS